MAFINAKAAPANRSGDRDSVLGGTPLDTKSNSANQAIELLEWTSLERGTLKGFATVRINRWGGLTIGGVAIHEHKNGKRWAQLPAKALLDQRTGELVKEANGRPRYVKVLSFDDQDVANRFNAAVIAAVEQAGGL